MNSKMKKIFTQLEEKLLHSPNWYGWDIGNFQTARNLWEKVKRLSRSPCETLDRIESLLPPQPVDPVLLNDYANFVCDGAAFFVMDLLESKYIHQGSTIIIPYYIYDFYKEIEQKGLIEIDSPEKSKLTLIVMREDPDKNPRDDEDEGMEFHFAVELNLSSEDRIAFHKPGYKSPVLSYLTTINSRYQGYTINYWAHKKDLL
ncbi:hypothetical protein J4221_00450 [Candidatus Pacearchaeota archaeon]|nr:hypothetical protein [Candidatus Pacearchaeota archaeon]